MVQQLRLHPSNAGSQGPWLGNKDSTMPRGTAKQLKGGGAGRGGSCPWGGLSQHPAQRCQYSSHRLRTSNSSTFRSPGFKGRSPGLCSVLFQRLSLSSLICHLGSGGQGHLARPSPSGPGPSLRQNWAPGTSEGRGLCTLPAHARPPSHLGGLWHPQAQPSHPLPP